MKTLDKTNPGTFHCSKMFRP